jgi:cob(I)alamin adenosyltransferase
MTLPTEPVTLTAAQVEELNRQLSTLRHDINNHLSLIMAAIELIRAKPQTLERMMVTLVDQPPKIGEAVAKYSTAFDKTFRIVRQ